MKRQVPSVFISYVQDDLPLALALKEWLAQRLGKSVAVFLAADRASLPLGAWWFPDLANALRSANVLLVIVSPSALYSQWIAYESGFVSGRGRPVIPILLPTVHSEHLAEPLRQRQFARLGSSYELAELLKRVASELHCDTAAGTAEEELLPSVFAEMMHRQKRTIGAAYMSSRDDLYREIIDRVADAAQPIVIRATSTQRTRDIGRDHVYREYLSAIAANARLRLPPEAAENIRS